MQHYSELSESERQLIEINRSIRNQVLLTRHCRPHALSRQEASGIEIGHVNQGVIYANTSDKNLIIKDALGLPIVIASNNVDRRHAGIPRLPWMKKDKLYIIRFNSFDASTLVNYHHGHINEIAADTTNAYNGLCLRTSTVESPHQSHMTHGIRQNIYDEIKAIADGMPTPATGFTVQEVPVLELSVEQATYIEAADIVLAIVEYRDACDGLYKELKYRGDLFHPSVSGLTSSQMHMLKNSDNTGTYFREIKVLDNKRTYEDVYVYVADYNGATPLNVQYDSSVSEPTIVVTEKDRETGSLVTKHIRLDDGHIVGVYKTSSAAENNSPTHIKNAVEKMREAEKTIQDAEHKAKIQDIRERINSAERKDIINKTNERSNRYEGLKLTAQVLTSIAAVLAAITTIFRIVNN